MKAALIDMDGVLYDSMPKHAKAWSRLMSELGVRIPEEEFFLYEGMTGAATIELLLRRNGLPVPDPEEIRRLYARKAAYFRESGAALPMEGADRMIRTLLDHGVRTVLVTGSAQSSLIDRLETDYPGAFPPERRVTALDVSRGKPDPEPYLRGLQIAGTLPEETMVIENAPLGVRAGVAAGLATYAVTTGPVPRPAFEAEHPTAIYPSMTAFADALPRILEDPGNSLS